MKVIHVTGSIGLHCADCGQSWRLEVTKSGVRPGDFIVAFAQETSRLATSHACKPKPPSLTLVE